MTRDISRLSKGQYDVLIVGGGINGAAIAHIAALNGLKTALIEKGDFASGTSSKSTKLIHGGLRYLENFEFDLVKESLRERSIQLKSAPHLVKPLPFIIPVFKDDARSLWMMRLGVKLYDFLSGKHHIGKHQAVTKEQVISGIPDIKQDGLVGGMIYYDAQMDDARLCLENILSAKEKGAHVANYTEARTFIQEHGKTIGVVAQDILGKKIFDIRAKKVICAAGPWINQFKNRENSRSPHKIRTTKGVHLMYSEKFSEKALLLTTQKDRRIFFVIPWHEHSLVGTTDTDYEGDPDLAAVEEEDIAYLMENLKRFFPTKHLDRSNIITTFAGLRPLVYSEGKPSSVSRRDLIEESFSGIIYVMGGKYTTYRKIAEHVFKKAFKKNPQKSEDSFSVYGSGAIEEEPHHVARDKDVDVAIVQHLMNFYGIRYKDVLALIEDHPLLKEPICSCTRHIKAQIVYALDKEMAQTADDIVERRLGLQWEHCPSKQCRTVVSDMVEEYRQGKIL